MFLLQSLELIIVFFLLFVLNRLVNIILVEQLYIDLCIDPQLFAAGKVLFNTDFSFVDFDSFVQIIDIHLSNCKLVLAAESSIMFFDGNRFVLDACRSTRIDLFRELFRSVG